MTKDEALHLALEALEQSQSAIASGMRHEEITAMNMTDRAIFAIKKASLEAKDEPVVWNEGVPAMLPKQKEGETFIVSYEPKLEAKDEPVAWQYRDANDDGTWSAWTGCDKRLTESDWRKVRPLYTTPPQRKPLTDEEIERIWESLPFCNGAWETFARAIEAAHGIKWEK